MKTRRIFSFFFSLFFLAVIAQQKKDSVRTVWKYEPNFMVGFDVLNAGMAAFSHRKVLQGYVSSRLQNNLHGIVQAGFEKNIYDKNGYDATASGPFAKLGAFYMLAYDRENTMNGFYAGAQLAGSFYRQEYRAIPVRGYAGSSTSVAYPSSTQSSYWVEGIIGGKVQLFETPFYIDVNVQPRYMVFSTKQDDIQPMIVPGFGPSSGKFNLGFSWNIAYFF